MPGNGNNNGERPPRPGGEERSPEPRAGRDQEAASPLAEGYEAEPDLPPTETAGVAEDEEDARRPPLLRYGVLGTLILAVVLVLAVLAVLPRNGRAPGPAAPVQAGAPTPRVYEEPLGEDLQSRAIRIDALITRTLLELGAAPDSIEALAFPAKGDAGFRARSMAFMLPVEPERFRSRLAALLAEGEPGALLTASGPRQFSIIVDGIRTHELFLDMPSQGAAPFAPQPFAPHPGAQAPGVVGRLAIVIDDMGEDVGLARGLAGTGLKLSFAAWPSSSHLDDVVALASTQGLDLLVHLPMEPRGYPDVDPGPDALYVRMTREEIEATVRRNLDRMPGAVGVNNHMGSRFTADLAGMRAALGVMAERGLFFLDSRTIGTSKGAEAARATGTPFYGRDVFIDNELRVDYIVGQLRKAETLARRHGTAIAIGHPHRETLEAIRSWAASAKGDVAVVSITELPLEQ
jgi:polysaccharide deacetylase 2 family uncharacterized protein YibQ